MLESVRARLQQLLSSLSPSQPPRDKSAATPTTPTLTIIERQWSVLEHAEGEKQLSNCRSLAAHLRALDSRVRSLEADVSRLKLLDLTAATARGDAVMTGSTSTAMRAAGAGPGEGAGAGARAGAVCFGEVGSARALARDKWKELTARFEKSSSRARSCVDSIEQFLRVEAFLELFGTLVTWCSATDEATERLCKPMPSTVREPFLAFASKTLNTLLQIFFIKRQNNLSNNLSNLFVMRCV